MESSIFSSFAEQENPEKTAGNEEEGEKSVTLPGLQGFSL